MRLSPHQIAFNAYTQINLMVHFGDISDISIINYYQNLNVHLLSKPSEALDNFKPTEYDLVILDVIMGMSGFSLNSEIR